MTNSLNSNASLNSEEQLGVFAKYWEPGQVKTRLAQDVGSLSACQIYENFVRHLLQKFSTMDLRRVIAITPSSSLDFFRAEFGNRWDVEEQSDGCLGQRMSHFFKSAFQDKGLQRVVLIGTDSPHLAPAVIHDAFSRLGHSELVLGPTPDGGYYLIGMSKFHPEVFAQINWSTPEVLSQTLAQAEQNQISYQLLPEFDDIDFVDDLHNVINWVEQFGRPDDKRLFADIQNLLSPPDAGS